MPHVFVYPALAFAAGTASGVWSGLAPGVFLCVLGGAASASLWCLRRHRPRELLIVVIIGWSAAGAALGSRADAEAQHPPLVARVAALSVGPTFRSGVSQPAPITGPRGSGVSQPGVPADLIVHVTGRLQEDAFITPSGVALSLEVEAVSIGAVTEPVTGGVRLTVAGELAASHVDRWRAGRTIRAPARLREPTRYENEGVPDHRLSLARRGTVMVGSIKSAVLVEVLSEGSWLDETAAAIRELVRRRVDLTVGRLGDQSGAIVTAVLIGDRAGIDDGVHRRMQEAGTYHVIAISGGNIAIFAVVLLGVCRLLLVPWRGSLAITALGLMAYGAIAIGDSSVTRAIVMALVYLAAMGLDHRGGTASALAIAGVLILCATPLAVFEAGTLLTFGATIAIVVGVPRMVAACRVRGWAAGLVGVAAASLASEVALLPIGASFFSRVTWAGLVLNLAAVPLMTVVQIGGLVAIGLSLLAEPLGRVAGWVPYLAAEGIVRSAALVEYVPWATWRVPAPPAWVVAAYYALLGAWLTREGWVRWLAPYSRVASRLVAAATVCAALLIVSGPIHSVWAGRPGILQVTALDVGQGDATVLRMPDGRTLLVDTGGLGGQARFDIGERVVAPALWALGVRRIEALVVSHGHPDHMGGAPAVVSMFRPREVWEGIPVAGDGPLEALAELAESRRSAWRRLRAGEVLTFGEVSVRVLHPGVPDWDRVHVRNDDSVVLDVRYGDVSIILPGDVGVDVERGLIPRLQPAGIRILKAAHHGSATSTAAEFVAAYKPQIAVVSCGRDNRFGHPVPAVIERLVASGAIVYRTDRDGAITIETDGRGVSVRTRVGGRQW